MAKIGGFFALKPGLDPSPDSVWQAWHQGSHQSLHLQNARSVIRCLVQAFRPQTIWLPSFLCDTLPNALKDDFHLEYYGIDEQFQEDAEALGTGLKAGDMVVGVDYFGRDPSAAFLELVKSRPDVIWTEDRAQAICPATTWGDWLIYSPRKLFGVADGGIGICQNPSKALPALPETKKADDYSFLMPSLMRYEDVDETNNAAWYKAYQDAERAQSADLIDMSRLSQQILETYSLSEVSVRRQQNAAILYDQLACKTVFSGPDETSVPGGVPIYVRNKADIVRPLAEQGIFLATHWPDIPAPIDIFPLAHDMSSRILTVPCDQRYGEEDMKKLAQAINQAIETYDR